MEGAIGIIVGALLSWVLAHYYYRKQVKEQINPLPYSQEVNHAVLELYGLAIDRKDEELRKKIKELVLAIQISRIRVLEKLAPANLCLLFLAREHNDQKIIDFVNQFKPQFKRAAKNIQALETEYSNMMTTASKVLGSEALQLLSQDDFALINQADIDSASE
jgi:hypothetical protein